MKPSKKDPAGANHTRDFRTLDPGAIINLTATFFEIGSEDGPEPIADAIYQFLKAQPYQTRQFKRFVEYYEE